MSDKIEGISESTIGERDCHNCQFCGQRYVGHADDGEEFQCLIEGWRAGPCGHYQPDLRQQLIESLRAEIVAIKAQLAPKQKTIDEICAPMAAMKAELALLKQEMKTRQTFCVPGCPSRVKDRCEKFGLDIFICGGAPMCIADPKASQKALEIQIAKAAVLIPQIDDLAKQLAYEKQVNAGLIDELAKARIPAGIVTDIQHEILAGQLKHGPFADRRAGLAVVQKQVHDLECVVDDPARARREAIQVAAAAIRLVSECIVEGRS